MNCIPFFQAVVTDMQTGHVDCYWLPLGNQEPLSVPWLLVGAVVLAVLLLAGSGSPRGKHRSENDEIIDILNDLIPKHQDEAWKNLTAQNPSHEAEKKYKTFVNQIAHDGEGYRWKG